MLLGALSLLIGLLALSLPVAAVLLLVALVLARYFSFLPLHRGFGEVAWSASTEFILVAIPLFILLGEITLRSGIAGRMYNALAGWLGWLPGGLMHANIASCALFAATSGSSVATAATIGTLAEPQIRRHGYHERLFLGTIAAGGTLGILIPPSINIIIYGVLTDTSIPQLYLAGIVPGLMLASLFILGVLVACLLRSSRGGVRYNVSWNERLRSLVHLVPPLVIFAVVIGSIYLGWATPTESASLGVLCALGLAALHGQLSLPILRTILEGTMRTTAMVMIIIIAAYCLNFVLSSIGLTGRLTEFVSGLSLSPHAMLAAIILFYLVLGFFMETLTLMITTLPIIAPIVFSLGFDPVWFGILLMLLIEMALITPPVGLNLYVVQGIRSSGSMGDVIAGSLPFAALILVMIGLLVAWPELALVFRDP